MKVCVSVCVPTRARLSCMKGMYKGGSFLFTFKINANYPHEPPKVKCEQKVRSSQNAVYAISQCAFPQIYHPNVDLAGNVCLNILREDWKPVLNLNSVMVGLQYLFLEPNADDPLNKGKSTQNTCMSCTVTHAGSAEAAEELKRNREHFVHNVNSSMRGGTIKGEKYDVVIKH